MNEVKKKSGIKLIMVRYYKAGYPDPTLKNCRISGIRLSSFGSISRISGYPAKSLSSSYIPNTEQGSYNHHELPSKGYGVPPQKRDSGPPSGGAP